VRCSDMLRVRSRTSEEDDGYEDTRRNFQRDRSTSWASPSACVAVKRKPRRRALLATLRATSRQQQALRCVRALPGRDSEDVRALALRGVLRLQLLRKNSRPHTQAR
jgi:hypothetical protein